jgi:hypothetical protein
VNAFEISRRGFKIIEKDVFKETKFVTPVAVVSVLNA